MNEEQLEALHDRAFEYRNAEPNAQAAWEALVACVETLMADAAQEARDERPS